MDERRRGEADLSGAVPLAARLDVGGLAAASVLAATRAAARLTGGEPRLDPVRIATAYSSERHLRIDGAQPTAFAELSGFFRTADGWVRTHGNYPHHAAALRRALGLADDADRDGVAHALKRTDADHATERIVSAGGICAAVRPEDPAADARSRSAGNVVTRRLGDAPARPLPHPRPEAPLAGVRVLDLTRVIAGPVCTRTLALLGAEVLRLDPPHLPEIAAQHLDTGHGKRSALLDVASPAGDARLFELLASADVVVLGYRPAGLDRLGLSPAALADRAPGVVVARLSAWGVPESRGFDSIVQAACGIAMIESADGTTPGALPAQALDHSAGYLLAAAIIGLLGRRASAGGSWLAETSLRRIAAELLGRPRAIGDVSPIALDTSGHTQRFRVAGVDVVTAAPAVTYAGGPEQFAAPRPWGEDEPAWRG
ncbi:CoA transferase [uncultured Microbacterium sp.]|uniref:L-carnitine dehydratase/bile acid-inducible protein F n=1 Tax=uncultured Microbacterium sp. TaxID=191216 RepID=A0A1Y5NYI0_9MICO|nr:CoA transferase [uncultured Microbacterium sp.]SBS71444.1 L-carnitine dehydratase/bile acid-inducible protein F [uncultured Microbacterium sp.]